VVHFHIVYSVDDSIVLGCSTEEAAMLLNGSRVVAPLVGRTFHISTTLWRAEQESTCKVMACSCWYL
jgi:hypothetical protein